MEIDPNVRLAVARGALNQFQTQLATARLNRVVVAAQNVKNNKAAVLEDMDETISNTEIAIGVVQGEIAECEALVEPEPDIRPAPAVVPEPESVRVRAARTALEGKQNELATVKLVKLQRADDGSEMGDIDADIARLEKNVTTLEAELAAAQAE